MISLTFEVNRPILLQVDVADGDGSTKEQNQNEYQMVT
jgi:hypothetical protein